MRVYNGNNMAQLSEFSQEGRIESASEAYEMRKTAIISKLYTLAERLQEHGTSQRIDWTHVGDLSYVDGQLQELLEFLTILDDRVA